MQENTSIYFDDFGIDAIHSSGNIKVLFDEAVGYEDAFIDAIITIKKEDSLLLNEGDTLTINSDTYTIHNIPKLFDVLVEVILVKN